MHVDYHRPFIFPLATTLFVGAEASATLKLLVSRLPTIERSSWSSAFGSVRSLSAVLVAFSIVIPLLLAVLLIFYQKVVDSSRLDSLQAEKVQCPSSPGRESWNGLSIDEFSIVRSIWDKYVAADGRHIASPNIGKALTSAGMALGRKYSIPETNFLHIVAEELKSVDIATFCSLISNREMHKYARIFGSLVGGEGVDAMDGSEGAQHNGREGVITVAAFRCSLKTVIGRDPDKDEISGFLHGIVPDRDGELIDFPAFARAVARSVSHGETPIPGNAGATASDGAQGEIRFRDVKQRRTWRRRRGRGTSAALSSANSSTVELRTMFHRLDSDGDGYITAADVQKALRRVTDEPVSISTCRQLIRRGSSSTTICGEHSEGERVDGGGKGVVNAHGGLSNRENVDESSMGDERLNFDGFNRVMCMYGGGKGHRREDTKERDKHGIEEKGEGDIERKA